MPKQWSIFMTDDSIPVIVISVNQGEPRAPTREEAEQAVSILNEEGSNVIRIHCRNEQCSGRGGWIERTRLDVSKNVYTCDVCNRPMER